MSGAVREFDPMSSTSCETTVTPPHPRVLGWFGTTALAMGGSNQMIFLITALFVGQGAILGQGSAAVPLLIGLGKALNIPVIAEGVETEGERLFLKREGRAEIQGYIIGYPRPIDNYARLTSGLDAGERAKVG
jgi:hypothetical protein